MATKKSDVIWMNGEFVAWDQANVHVMSHVIHYGSGLFEGIRCYQTSDGPAVYRLGDHVKRLYNSCKIYRMVPRWSPEEFTRAILETTRRNHLAECYIRPLVYRGLGSIGVNPAGASIDAFIAVFEWGKYLGDEALSEGVDVMVSSWQRMAPNTFPAMAKCSGHYVNSQLIKMEALANGCAEGIALDVYGYVSEGSGENIFLVVDGELVTPPLGNSILPGVTRASVIQLARDLGYTVHERVVPREMLYIADEVFFTGTAAEITPIRSVDKVVVGSGRRGKVTEALLNEFFAIIRGDRADRHGWLTKV